MPLAEQLDSAIAAARKTDHQAWALPEKLPKEVPQVKTTDPRMAEDLGRVMEQMTDAIGKAVAQKRESRLEFGRAISFSP